MRRAPDKADKARSYFAQAGFKRLLPLMWKRYEGLGKTGGHAVVRGASPEECEAINAFMGWYERPGSDIRVPLQRFESELLQSVFACSIGELYELLYGEPLLTKSERTLLEAKDWQDFFARLKEDEGDELVSGSRRWLDALCDGCIAAGYRMARDLWTQSPSQAQWELTIALRAMNRIAAESVSGEPPLRLPVLAALVSGNPHALDRTMAAGRLFFQGLRFSLVQSFSSHDESEEHARLSEDEVGSESGSVDSLRVREIYRAAGVLDDDISSLVHLYESACGGRAAPYVMTLRQAESTESLPTVSDIYVVENPAVFSTLVDDSSGMATISSNRLFPLLICTSGPASAAALRILERYAQNPRWKGKLYYSGDFDVKGIEIGNVLALRYPQFFTNWRFDAASYIQGISEGRYRGIQFSNEEDARLNQLQAAWDASLMSVMREHGFKLYQEQILGLLRTDWREAVNGGETNKNINLTRKHRANRM